MDKETEKKIREFIREEVDHFFAENLEPLIQQEVSRLLDLREMDKQLAEASRWKGRKAQELVRKLETVLWCLKNYVDSKFHRVGRPTIVLADQTEMGMGYAAHISGDPGDFKKLGFEGYSHFYDLPIDKRNQFLREGLKEFRRILGEEVNPKLDLEELQQKFDLLQKSFERIRSAL
jgi:hypothetical protein